MWKVTSIGSKYSYQSTSGHRLSSILQELPISGTEEDRTIPQAAMATSSSLGTLVVLPREIRDHIYGYVISDRYRAYYSDSIVNDYIVEESEATGMPWEMYHQLGIACTSRLLCDEVSQILYNKAMFCFQQYGTAIAALESPLEQNVKLIERIMNIELFIFISDPHIENFPVDHKDPGPLTFFHGSVIPRKSAIIRITSTSKRFFAGALLQSPLVNAIKGLVGFKSVILKAAYERTLSTTTVKSSYGSSIGTFHGELYQKDPTWQLLSMAKENLGPHIGPSDDISELVSPSGGSVWKDGYRQIEFHPREYVTNAMKICKDVSCLSSTQ